MEFENIKEALQGSEDLQKTVLELLTNTEHGKKVLNNFADSYAEERIKSNTRETYSRIDELLEANGFEAGGRGRNKNIGLGIHTDTHSCVYVHARDRDRDRERER